MGIMPVPSVVEAVSLIPGMRFNKSLLRCADTDQLAVGYRDLCILDHHYINVTALG